MAVNIEDAGFEIRDMIAWVYGCLSEDTEILTESGYKPLHKLTQYDRIGVYDITNNIYKWERPQRYSVYKVHQDTAFRIKSDYTDQIVSRNHRCLVEREGKLVFIQAEELNEVEYMPTLSEDFYSLQERHRELLLKELLRKGKGLAQKLFSKRTGKEMSSERIEVRKEPSLERWSNLLEETRKLQADKICEVSEGVFTDGEKRWICNGTSFDNGSILGDMFRENPNSASYQSRPTGQPTGKSDVIPVKQGTQIIRRARVEKIEYSGIIFCPTVSTGAFVARRNGQVFITGNSGFPKSLNIGKAVDKIQGNEREVVATKEQSGAKFKTAQEQMDNGGFNDPNRTNFSIDKGTSEWEGWGTALKPALEPITVARKPLEKGLNVAENCLKWGVGGINIDGCRVGTDTRTYKGMSSNKPEVGTFRDDNWKPKNIEVTATGRFPANLIHDGSDEVRECFPEQKSSGNRVNVEYKNPNKSNVDFGGGIKNDYNDSGNASRFFYCAKASKRERNKGLENMEKKAITNAKGNGLGRVCNICGANQLNPCNCKNNTWILPKKNQNNHPTVKPIALMEYLVKLVSREGQVVLDPFMGSGTTGMACVNTGRDFIGIEIDEDYFKIAQARIESCKESRQLTFE